MLKRRRPIVRQSNRDYYGGALMMAIGIGAMVQGRHYSIGTLSRMGPGYFPVALGAILTLVGLAIIATARFTKPESEEAALPPEWRGWFCIGAMVQGRHYSLGTLSRMGPGYFPVALGAILTLVGLAIIATARFTKPEGEEAALPPGP